MYPERREEEVCHVLSQGSVLRVLMELNPPGDPVRQVLLCCLQMRGLRLKEPHPAPSKIMFDIETGWSAEPAM